MSEIIDVLEWIKELTNGVLVRTPQGYIVEGTWGSFRLEFVGDKQVRIQVYIKEKDEHERFYYTFEITGTPHEVSKALRYDLEEALEAFLCFVGTSFSDFAYALTENGVIEKLAKKLEELGEP